MANSEYKILLEKYTQLYEENIKLKLKNAELETNISIYKENTDKSSTNFSKTEEYKAILEENVRLKERILHLESVPKENINLSIQTKPTDNSENEGKIRILTDNNSYLSSKIGELESEIKCLKERINKFDKISIGLFGYAVKYEGNIYRLLSVYAFDDEDEIVIELVDKNCIVQVNPFFNQWKDQFKEFVMKGKSWSAFLAHVTISLFNQKTFG